MLLKWWKMTEKPAHQPEFGHFSPSGICLQYLPGAEDLPIFTATTRKLGFLDFTNHTGEKREGRGERGAEKGTAGTHNFYIAHFGDSFWTTKKFRLHTARTSSAERYRFQKSGYILWPRNAEFPLIIFGHFSPSGNSIYPDFWKRYRSAEVSERCVASTFLSFRNYLQSGQYKNYECQQSFFLLPSLPSLLFSLPCGL